MWTDVNGREYAEFERSGDTYDCADEEMAKLAQARREQAQEPPTSEETK